MSRPARQSRADWRERCVVRKRFQPIKLWQATCNAAVTGQAPPAGHYIPKELPKETAETFRGS